MPLAAHDLAFAYPTGQTVLRNISLEIAPARLTVIAGPNGAGKTTLLRLMLGLLTPDAGRITLDGSPVHAIPPASRARRLAYIAQRPDIAFDFSLRRVVAFGAYRGQPARDVIAAALADMELAGEADRPFSRLSTGQQQRGSIARGLVQLRSMPNHPRALLADEPVAALDPRHQLRVLALLRSLAEQNERTAVVVVLHDLTLAARFAHDVILLSREGHIAAAGPVEQTLTPGTLAEVYNAAFQSFRAPGLDHPVPIAVSTR